MNAEQSGTYEWRAVASHAIVTGIRPDGRRIVAAPQAKETHHRFVVLWSDAPVGATGELRYVSNFPRWARLDFEPDGQVLTDPDAFDEERQ